MTDNIRLDTLLEVYDCYLKSEVNIGIWLYNQIKAEAGIIEIPLRQHGEIVFCFCDGCGMDYLVWPDKCKVIDCGCEKYHQLGTQQALIWRRQRWPNGDYKYRTVR